MVFKSLLAVVALVVTSRAAKTTSQVTCADGNYAPYAECCPFFALRDDLLANLFTDCAEEVHESLRLAFHDAIPFSNSLLAQGLPAGGGADGSMIIFPDVEPNFPANLGISDSVQFLTPFLQRHNDVTAGDLIQFAAAVGITQCPGAPSLQFLVGRPNATAPAPDGLVPEPQDPLDKIFARFADAGPFGPQDVVASLVSHTIARSDHIDPTIQAVPFDSTPFTFDTQFFLEVLLQGTGFPGTPNNTGESESPLPLGEGLNVGEMRLQSDFLLARDPETACTWQSFVDDQATMTYAFQQVMANIAVIGQDVYSLVDCSSLIPTAPPLYTSATFPATKSAADLELTCTSLQFPDLATDPGTTQSIIPHCPSGETTC